MQTGLWQPKILPIFSLKAVRLKFLAAFASRMNIIEVLDTSASMMAKPSGRGENGGICGGGGWGGFGGELGCGANH